MSEFGSRAIDLAEERVERERAAGVRRAQDALRGMSGRFVCDCGAEISPARRAAMPNTDDCIDCATFKERQARRSA